MWMVPLRLSCHCLHPGTFFCKFWPWTAKISTSLCLDFSFWHCSVCRYNCSVGQAAQLIGYMGICPLCPCRTPGICPFCPCRTSGICLLCPCHTPGIPSLCLCHMDSTRSACLFCSKQKLFSLDTAVPPFVNIIIILSFSWLLSLSPWISYQSSLLCQQLYIMAFIASSCCTCHAYRRRGDCTGPDGEHGVWGGIKCHLILDVCDMGFWWNHWWLVHSGWLGIKHSLCWCQIHV